MLRDSTATTATAASAEPRPFAAYLVAAFLSASLLALPFLAVRFPPITDLPQQAAQIRLLAETISDSSPYRLNLAAPGALGYGAFGIAWITVGPANAGRFAYLGLGLLWVTALAATIRSCQRDPVLIPLASLFFFSHILYWGFFSFLFGATLFLLWTALERRLRAGPGGPLEIIGLALANLAIYSSHLFWFLVAALWLLTVTLMTPLPPRRRWIRLATLLPAGALVAAWMPRLAQSGFGSETMWWVGPLGRLAPNESVARIFGGLHGPVEPVILGALVTWLAIGVWQSRDQLRRAIDPTLLLLGGLMLVASLLLPDRYSNTLHFAGRWAPIGMALVLLALPPPKIRHALRWLVAFVLLATLTVSTTAAWRRFEQLELAGLEESLAALPEDPRFLGLDFYRLSQIVKTQPFFQNHAYGQVLRGGTLGFSFASFPASPVVYAEWENPPWTPGLEWLPHEIFESIEDVLYFDFVLIHADPPGHAFFAQQRALEPVTEMERWRLYRVVKSASG